MNTPQDFELESQVLSQVKLMLKDVEVVSFLPIIEIEDDWVGVYEQQWVQVGQVVNERALVQIGLFKLEDVLNYKPATIH